MTIFEINEEILKCVDLETGEMLDEARIEELDMEREKKIEGVAIWYKDCIAQAEVIKAEAKKLTERASVLTNKAESLKNYLNMVLAGDKFQTERVQIRYRKSESVMVDKDQFSILTADERFLTYKDPEPNRVEIRKALKAGEKVVGCTLEVKQNIQII